MNNQNSTQLEELERWNSFRIEMEKRQERLVQLAKDFLELGAFDDAAKCAIKADGLKYVLNRMPSK